MASLDELKAFEGTWVLNRAASDNAVLDEVLAMQGMPWLMRKAASLATPSVTVKVVSKKLAEVDWDGKGLDGDEHDPEEETIVFEVAMHAGIPAMPTRTQHNPLHGRKVSHEIRIPGFPPKVIVFVSNRTEGGIVVRSENEAEGWTNEARWSLEDGGKTICRDMVFTKGGKTKKYVLRNTKQ
ncbi:hypothetical protein DFJ74DRAFT_666474 [Hyaloraphidium curvatum]|nr:hypothetical protein DFJ74DRAFT_666474 [Hyaloraphidium curvatum]